MHDLFNPAGLGLLEDRQGAIAFGYVAPRVFYSRLVGCLSPELERAYAEQLASASREGPSFAYFADASALRAGRRGGRSVWMRSVRAWRAKLSSLVILTSSDAALGARALCETLGEGANVLCDPLEFEGALCNVAPVPKRGSQLPLIWPAPRRE